MSDDTTPGISTPETVTADLIDSIRKDIKDLDDLMYARDVRHDVMASGLSSAMCTLTLLVQMLEDGLLVNRAMVTPRIRQPVKEGGQKCIDCNTDPGDVWDEWETLEALPLCGSCASKRIRKRDHHPPEWEYWDKDRD